MYFFVGSTNPVKVNAVKEAVGSVWQDTVIEGFEVESGVSLQPLTDQETMQGAINRAKAALEKGLASFIDKNPSEDDVLGVGMEGGVTLYEGKLWSTVWAAVVTAQGQQCVANGARVEIPEVIAARLRAGEEMGPIMQDLTKIQKVGKKQGMFGIITNGFIDRTEEYAGIVKTAIGLWYGRDWQENL